MGADVFIQERILRFLRPMCEGGMGSANTAFMLHCFGVSVQKLEASLWSLEQQGKLRKGDDGRWWIVYDDRVKGSSEAAP